MATFTLNGSWMIESAVLSQQYVIVTLYFTDINDYVTAAFSTLSVATGASEAWNVAGNAVGTSVTLQFSPEIADPGPYAFAFTGSPNPDGTVSGQLSGAIVDPAAKLVPVASMQKGLSGSYGITGAGMPADWQVVTSLQLNEINEYVTGALNTEDPTVPAASAWDVKGNDVQGAVSLVFRYIPGGVAPASPLATFAGTYSVTDGSVTGNLTYNGATAPVTILPAGASTPFHHPPPTLSGTWMFSPPPTGWVVRFLLFTQTADHVSGTLDIQLNSQGAKYNIQGSNVQGPTVGAMKLVFVPVVGGSGPLTFDGNFTSVAGKPDADQIQGTLTGVSGTVTLVRVKG
jgi:hypothetical protein